MASVRTISILNIKITASTKEMRKDLRDAQIQLGKFTNFVKRTTIALAKMAAVAAVAFVGWGIKLAAEAETARVAFTTLLKSEKASLDLLKEIKAFASTTPFQTGDLIQAGKVLLAFGIEAKNVVTTLRQIGDAASGTGSNLGELVAVYGKILSSGKLTGETLLQLQERAVPILRVLADQLGKTEAEIRSMVTAGQIGSEDIVKAFENMSAAGGEFFGSTVDQSQTLAGRMSTLRDNVDALALSVGNLLLPAMETLVEDAQELVKWLQQLEFETVRYNLKLIAMAAAFAIVLAQVPKFITAISTIVVALRALASAQAITLALSGVGIAALIAATAAAIAAGLAVNAAFNAIDADLAEAAEGAKALSDEVKDGLEEIPGLVEAGSSHLRKMSLAFADAAKAAAAFDAKVKSIIESAKSPMERLADEIRTVGEVWAAIPFERRASVIDMLADKWASITESVKEASKAARGRPVAALDIRSQAGMSAVNESVRIQHEEAAERARFEEERRARDEERDSILTDIKGLLASGRTTVRKVSIVG